MKHESMISFRLREPQNKSCYLDRISKRSDSHSYVGHPPRRSVPNETDGSGEVDLPNDVVGSAKATLPRARQHRAESDAAGDLFQTVPDLLVG